MANEVLQKSGTFILVADSTDYPSGSKVLGAAATDQIDLTSLASTAARQSAKIDLGATRAAQFDITLAVEFDVAPTSGDIVSLWWAPSPNATAANANPGGVSGSDSAYTGTGSDSLADSILQLQFVGALVCTSDLDPTVSFQTFRAALSHRYGTFVVYNEAGQAFNTTDAQEMGILVTPIIDEVQ